MKKIKIFSIFIMIIVISVSCSKEDSSDQTTLVGSPATNSNTKSIEFLFSPNNGNIAGNGKVFYDNNGTITYVFGTATNSSSWTGSNTAQSTSIYSAIPPGVLVHYAFTSNSATGYAPPMLTIKYHNSVGTVSVLSAASSALSGSFYSPQ